MKAWSTHLYMNDLSSIIPNSQKSDPATGEWIDKRGTSIQRNTLERNKLLIHVTTLYHMADHKSIIIMLSERSQPGETTCCMSPLIRNIQKRQICHRDRKQGVGTEISSNWHDRSY